MAIYGVALLSFCMFVGVFTGDLLGISLGVKANVGGVGFAMLLLILITEYCSKNNLLSEKSQAGIAFWSSMYIPIVVAMTAKQNVVAAIKGGPLAILAGVVAVSVAFAFIPIINKIGVSSKSESKDVN